MIMFENEYQIAWGIYCAAGLLAMLVWFKMTGWMWRYLREPLWILMALIIFTPAVAGGNPAQYSPAIVVIAADKVLHHGTGVFALEMLLSYAIIAFAAYIVFALVRLPFLIYFNKRKKAKAQAKQYAEQQQAGQQAQEAQITEKVANLVAQR